MVPVRLLLFCYVMNCIARRQISDLFSVSNLPRVADGMPSTVQAVEDLSVLDIPVLVRINPFVYNIRPSNPCRGHEVLQIADNVLHESQRPTEREPLFGFCILG